MTPKEFNKRILKPRLKKIEEVLSLKEKEYADKFDRLRNFNELARIDDSSSEEILWGMYLKHFYSVREMIKYQRVYSDKYIEEKIGDSINYHILLEAILKERNMRYENENIYRIV